MRKRKKGKMFIEVQPKSSRCSFLNFDCLVKGTEDRTSEERRSQKDYLGLS